VGRRGGEEETPVQRQLHEEVVTGIDAARIWRSRGVLGLKLDEKEAGLGVQIWQGLRRVLPKKKIWSNLREEEEEEEEEDKEIWSKSIGKEGKPPEHNRPVVVAMMPGRCTGWWQPPRRSTPILLLPPSTLALRNL
jgi:hypothetical protein